jgi:SAM-dependent methyltransferase
MLEAHLDADADMASRRVASIDAIVAWMDDRFGLEGKAICDLGCGPGLYASRLAERGARVTGLDFSARSIDFGCQAARDKNLALHFEVSDYLKDDLPAEQDLVLLIYADLCALAPDQRRILYAKVQASLKPGGYFVCDVFSRGQFDQREEGMSYGWRLMDGFWAAGDYFGFLTTFLYDDLNLALDRYLIVEPPRRREVFNWLQYFDPESLTAELGENGFDVEAVVDVLTGEPWQVSASEFALIARR